MERFSDEETEEQVGKVVREMRTYFLVPPDMENLWVEFDRATTSLGPSHQAVAKFRCPLPSPSRAPTKGDSRCSSLPRGYELGTLTIGLCLRMRILTMSGRSEPELRPKQKCASFASRVTEVGFSTTTHPCSCSPASRWGSSRLRRSCSNRDLRCYGQPSKSCVGTHSRPCSMRTRRRFEPLSAIRIPGSASRQSACP
jgi:hypothetical protein